ncbi:RNA polymerase II transcriptional coactivator KELP-like protein [Trifolium pratense]|uniref:RNA polymerase II transcriptional coactivator KELP-like protein n=2 Tax=Trifolium pratense TaxID=57577 RepID=A0A2K3LJU7_TRIPR|nr:RNA polymerase II transcriptional coactivator KELP-like protein [Trifolium pratense]PNX78718.1 RNA polymerase II transcriptional coactivator KELP-like protein [Trifolium pratense]PNX78805.1 RNA polymerase II transcriptional coactivator KELP-like protein [Trifolium pratense]
MEDAETKSRIEETVLKILHESNMEEVTESKIRKQASTELDLNLNQPPFKALVKQIIEDFLVEKQQQQQKQEEEEEEKQEVKQKGVSSKSSVYVDSGDLVICELSQKKKVTIQDFKGRRYVSIREFYTKDGKELPSSKDVSGNWDCHFSSLNGEGPDSLIISAYGKTISRLEIL